MKSEVTIERKDLLYAFAVACAVNAAKDMERGDKKNAAGNVMLNSCMEMSVTKILFPEGDKKAITLTRDTLMHAFAEASYEMCSDSPSTAKLLVMLMTARINSAVYGELFGDDEEEEPDDPEKELADAIAGENDEAEH